ncbi:MAG: TIGR02710 family CRISPR-associated protein [Chloroflexi bacterium]|nr:MAG: TIGR02710 family CRISPR-associated protein [Chloroflexota bacterium]
MTRAMLISVGSTSEAIVYTLKQTRPSCVIFFLSPETKERVPAIIRALDFELKGFDQIITPSAELLWECYKTLLDQLPQKLQTWRIEPRDLVVDYTGGTKTMSAALVLATIDLGCSYSYVGGVERDKGGIGVVLDGKERMWYVDNPWDDMAVFERKKANLLFNAARYAAAKMVLDDICSKVSPQQRPFYETWSGIVHAYDLWDRFKHKEAHHLLGRGLRDLRLMASSSDSLQRKVGQLDQNFSFLSQLTEGKDKGLLVYDLVANAMRRADLENKYDDAVARLYRAIEKAAQDRLRAAYQIEPSSASPQAIPATLRAEYLARYSDDKGRLRIPLYACYRLLAEQGDGLGARFLDRYEHDLKALLGERNDSILAHGDKSVREERYRELLRVVMDFIPLEEEKIPRFPDLEL